MESITATATIKELSRLFARYGLLEHFSVRQWTPVHLLRVC